MKKFKSFLEMIFVGFICCQMVLANVEKQNSRLMFAAPDSGGFSLNSQMLPDEEKATINPGKINKGVINNPVEITLLNCDKGWEGLFFKVDPGSLNLLSNAGIQISDFRKIEITSDVGKCSASAKITVSKTTPSDKYAFKIGVAVPSGTAAVPGQEIILEIGGVSELTPGPVPPGLDPQVDIMWAVVPKKIVKDNFGPLIARRFYCIEVVIGNNSGYDLQIASVGFKLGPVGKLATTMANSFNSVAQQQDRQRSEFDSRLTAILGRCRYDTDFRGPRSEADCVSQETDKVLNDVIAVNAQLKSNIEKQSESATAVSRIMYRETIPVTSYLMARGTASHGQFLNAKNITMAALQALGPILTGITPLLTNQTDYVKAVNLFSNPIVKGIESVFPDETIPRLQRLDDQILRDGLIISNNRQIRTRAFVPKALLQLDEEYLNNPMIITQALGKLFIIGDQIQYLNRVSVTSGSSGEIVPPPTVTPSEHVFFLGTDDTLNLTGNNLDGALITSPEAEIEVLEPRSSTKTTATAKIRVKPTAKLGDHKLNLTTPRGSVPISITVKQNPPTIAPAGLKVTNAKSANDTNPPKSLQTESQEFTVELNGQNLQGATLVPISDDFDNPLRIKDGSYERKPEGNLLKATILIPPGTKTHTYLIKLGNQSENESDIGIKFPVIPGEGPAVNNGEDGISFFENRTPVEDTKERTYSFTIKGKNLTYINKNIKSIPTNGKPNPLTIENVTLKPDGTVTADVKVPKGTTVSGNALKEDFTFQISDVDTVPKDITFTISLQRQGSIEVTPPTDEKKIDVNFELSGKNLAGLRIDKEDEDPNWEVVIVDEPTPTSTKFFIKITQKPTAQNPERKVTVKFTNLRKTKTGPITIPLVPAT